MFMEYGSFPVPPALGLGLTVDEVRQAAPQQPSQ
jgi:hypothetical protein